jgi:hypothetical protein
MAPIRDWGGETVGEDVTGALYHFGRGSGGGSQGGEPVARKP